MTIAVLYPRFDHPAIEERYASWQSEARVRRQGSEFHFYDRDETAGDVAGDVHSEHVLVVTDPLVVAPANLAIRLAAALGDADAAVPVSNEAPHPSQRTTPAATYMTLNELDATVAMQQAAGSATEVVHWQDTDPGIYLCRRALLDKVRDPLSRVLKGKRVAISKNDYVHQWASMRGQVRQDLLDRIAPDARNILEFGCGEGNLGAALKARQKCSVVGVEIDPAAAAVARRRLDDVYCGDVREIVSLLNQRFDWIVGGDIVEHLDEPWSFLADLRRITEPGGRLLLSLPNIANASIIGGLLQGRFDYVYMGLTCVGHLRFFTRSSIEDMFAIAGWASLDITPQPIAVTPAASALIDQLTAAGIAFSREDLVNSGYYVVARNR
jgi:2-polyprenyl-3-methyl-5-hydroxy-6-metoxy-1,4-benzoquinol methylase